MPRPFRCRRIFFTPQHKYFKPCGIPLSKLEEINLTLDELEAIRLADKEGLYQEEASKKMNISRQTFGNIIDSAHKKIAQFLTESKALCIKGGEVEMIEKKFVCYDCKKELKVPFGTPRPAECPECKSKNIHRAVEDRGWNKTMNSGRRCFRRW
jgi:predicted DNA-binding protein (UPF0251 family)